MKSLALTLMTGIIFIPRVTFTRNALSDIGKERERTGRKKLSILHGKEGWISSLTRNKLWRMMTRVSRCVSGYTHARGKKRAKEIGVVTRVKKPENGGEASRGRGRSAEKGLLRYIWVLLNITRVCETLLLPSTLAFQELPLRTAPFANHPPVHRHH